MLDRWIPFWKFILFLLRNKFALYLEVFWIEIHKYGTIKYSWTTEVCELNVTSTGQELSTSNTLLRESRIFFCFLFFMLTQSFQMGHKKIYQCFSEGLWNAAEMKSEPNFHWKLKCRTILLLRKFSNKINFSFSLTIGRKDTDTTRVFSILGLNICNIIVYIEM